MDQQALALSQMAEATLKSSKALEQMAEASHKQVNLSIRLLSFLVSSTSILFF